MRYVTKSSEGGWQFIKFSTSPLANIAGYVWLFGSLLLLCIQVISERRFRRRLTECREEITVCGQKAYKVRGISTPLLFRSSGFTLDIYIPEEIIEQEKLVAHAVLHENVHKKHGDIWWGYLRNLLVAAYWFHPLVWVAAFCSKRDCEYACDSSVKGQMDQEERISYGNSLLSLVQLGREGNLFHVATLMSIRKSELKKRIYLVKRGKRNGIAATVVTALVIAMVSISTFTGVKAEANPERESQLQEEVSETGGQQQEAKGEAAEQSISAGTKEAVGAGTEEAAEQTVPALEKESSELTMEKLLDSYHNEELSKWSIKKILKYDNISEVTKEYYDDSRAFEGILPYEGIDYRLCVSYYKKKLSEMWLENKETGEDKKIYARNENGSEDLLVSLDIFLHHDRILDEEISYTLPEKLLETKDSYNVGVAGGIGRLFCRDEKEKYGLYSVPAGGILRFWWNSTGGLMKSRLVYDKEDKMVVISGNQYTNNFTRETREFQGGKLQSIDGCENVTSLQGVVYTPLAEGEFNRPNWYSQNEARDLTKKETVEALSGRKCWVIHVLDKKKIEEKEPLGYIFFFDAERYTKKQMIALAKSVHLK